MADDTEMRPNIRIEISNNLVESMEVDEEKNGEEGEIIEPQNAPQENDRPKTTNRIWANSDGGFSTGINIFDKEHQEKLSERAKRFTLNPDEINNFTDEQLQKLHDSLGITAENEKEVRFEAIHMHGTDEMSTQDVLDYFYKYGPSGIEWIDDSSCNVVWEDKVTAARALHFASKPIRNLPSRGPCDPFVKEFLCEDKVALRNPDREVELQEEKEENSVDVADISCPIPPGYWQLGVEHRKAKHILLRFAFRTDKKPFRAEKLSNYYRKYGNPNYGGMRGIISETLKQKFKGIFDRNQELTEGSKEVGKNPWGGLAEKWNDEVGSGERESVRAEVKNPVLLGRLGFKRGHKKEESDDIPKKTKIPRMRMYADEEEAKIKRKKQLAALKTTVAAPTDLRSRLEAKPTLEPSLPPNENLADLGTKLKNRQKRQHLQEFFNVIRQVQNDLTDQPTRDTKKKNKRSKSPEEFMNKLHSDRYEKERRKRREPSYVMEDYDDGKPRSKVAVVVKTQKQPTVASQIWSRVTEKERLKTVSEGKLRRYSSSSSSSSGSSDDGSSSVVEVTGMRSREKLDRPGFRNHLKAAINKLDGSKSPLRIEISNDHFRKE